MFCYFLTVSRRLVARIGHARNVRYYARVGCRDLTECATAQSTHPRAWLMTVDARRLYRADMLEAAVPVDHFVHKVAGPHFVGAPCEHDNRRARTLEQEWKLLPDKGWQQRLLRAPHTLCVAR